MINIDSRRPVLSHDRLCFYAFLKSYKKVHFGRFSKNVSVEGLIMCLYKRSKYHILCVLKYVTLAQECLPVSSYYSCRNLVYGFPPFIFLISCCFFYSKNYVQIPPRHGLYTVIFELSFIIYVLFSK